jgi:hypothetical protein
MNKHNETNLAKVGRILAAAALLIEVLTWLNN